MLSKLALLDLLFIKIMIKERIYLQFTLNMINLNLNIKNRLTNFWIEEKVLVIKKNKIIYNIMNQN
jgi:hypothetical protein